MKKISLRILLILTVCGYFISPCATRTFAQGKAKPKPAATPATAGRSVAVAPSAASSARYALVIGNSAYPGMSLKNPVRDADLIADSLSLIGFRVTKKKDQTLAEMRRSVADFSRDLPPGAVALFFFAGHGVQVSGRNFLLPLDYKSVRTEHDLIASQLDLDTIVASLSSKSSLAIVILDACRNNAIELALSFNAEQGFLAPKKNSAGIYIAYSTSPGETALDGKDNSPYAKALAKNLRMRPGRLEDVFIKTRIEVRNDTAVTFNQEQVPWESGSLSTLFYFTADSTTEATTSTTVTVASNSGNGGLSSFTYNVPHLDDQGFFTGNEKKTNRSFIEKSSAAGIEMVSIPGGSFQMGSSSSEVETAFNEILRINHEVEGQINQTDKDIITSEMPRHRVNLNPFFMGKYEITQGQWRRVMGDLPDGIPAELRGDDKPVVNVTWGQATKFCEILNKNGDLHYRLPTEAEWEYAARAGTESLFSYGDNINSTYVNFFAWVPFNNTEKGEFRRRTVGMGEIEAPNNFGLYNMEGNVWEWCEDSWHWDYNGAPTDGSAWRAPLRRVASGDDGESSYRVIRGGAYDSIGSDCRSAHRRAKPMGDEYMFSNVGFRVIATR
jgi:formylglycine-generating enzyme required for sulfatase activity